jgi:hypothetical protein
MSRRTVIKYLDRLIEDGYVEDLTPGVKNKPHTYSVKCGEDKILAEVQCGMQISHTESDIIPQGVMQDKDVGMRNLHSESAEIAQPNGATMQELPTGRQNLHSDYAENAQDGMQNLHLNRESLDIDSRDNKKSAATPPIKPHSIPAVGVFVEVTGKYCLSKPQMKEVEEVIGDSPTSLEKWRGVVKEWLMRGFKPTNVAGMLEWFKGEIPVYQNGVKQNGQPAPQKSRPSIPIDEERLKELQQQHGLIGAG